MENELTTELLTDTVDNGIIENVHLAPIGEFLGSDAEGNPVPEKIDVESLQKLADSLNASETEVLADVDHGAAKPGVERETRSAGWFTRFVVDPLKGLFATLKLTKHGKELLENREYRYISPTFSLDEDGRPVELHTASLTNLPAFKGHINPILNTEAVEVSNDEGKLIMEMTKEELVDLIKETVNSMTSEKTDAVVEEVKEEVKEEAKEEKAENACSATKEEVTNTETEAETKEEVKEEVKEETPEEKVEVLKEAIKDEDKLHEEVKESLEEKLEDAKDEAKAENSCSEEDKKDKVTNEETEEKEEVIKIEALNAAPVALKDVSGKDKWMNLHGDDFWKYLAAHPEIKG